MNKNFLGRTLINPARKPRELEEVKLEDPEFCKQYKIYSTDQVEARYIFTTAFIERFRKIKDIYSANEVKAIFEYNTMLLAISTKNLFEVVSLSKSLNNTRQYEEFFFEFCLIFELIEELKLNTKIGL